MQHLHVTDASIAAIQQAGLIYGIEHFLILATYFPFKGKGLHNKALLERLRDHSSFSAIGSLDAMNHFETGFDELVQLGDRFVGFKLYPGYQNIEIGSPQIARVIALAQTLGLPVTIHGGELHHCCSSTRRVQSDFACENTFCWIDQLGMLAHPRAMESVIKAFPDVTFVIAHLANPFFEELRDLMRQYPNVMTDLSGQFVSGTDEDTQEYRQIILRELMRFIQEVPNGSERLLFGSDFPIQSFEATIHLIESLPVVQDIKDSIYRYNALRVYSRLAI